MILTVETIPSDTENVRVLSNEDCAIARALKRALAGTPYTFFGTGWTFFHADKGPDTRLEVDLPQEAQDFQFALIQGYRPDPISFQIEIQEN